MGTTIIDDQKNLNGGPAHFKGLSNRAKLAIIVLSGLFAGLSIFVAWSQALAVNQRMSFDSIDIDALDAISQRASPLPGSNNRLLLVHTLNLQGHLKAITNHQSLALLAIGSGFALLSIGFALFLIGADGAFRLQYEQRGDSKLIFYGTAPGLLCFLLATIVIVVGTTRKHELTIGDYVEAPSRSSTPLMVDGVPLGRSSEDHSVLMGEEEE